MQTPHATTPTRHPDRAVGTQVGTHAWSPFYRAAAHANERTRQGQHAKAQQTSSFHPMPTQRARPPDAHPGPTSGPIYRKY